MPVFAHEGHDAQRLVQGFGGFVGPVGGGERLEHIGQRHHTVGHCQALGGEFAGVAVAVHFFVVGGGNFGHPGPLRGPGQAFEHDVGLHDVVVDFEAVFVGQRAPPGGQVVELAHVLLGGGQLHVKAVHVARVALFHGGFALAPGHHVFGPVGQQGLCHGQGGGLGLGFGQAAGLFGGQAQAVVKVALPGLPGNGLQAGQGFIGHELTAHVALGHKGKVALQLGVARVALGLAGGGVGPGGQALQVGNFGVAPQHLKTGAHLVDAVVNDLQLGGLVHDVFGAGDLAAVVQPGAQVELVALLVAHAKVGVGAAGVGAQAVHQRGGQLGHALAVTAGVGAFGVDGVGHEADDGIEQVFLRGHQLPGFDGHGQHARELVREVEEGGVGVVVVGRVHQHQQPLQPTRAAAQLHVHLRQIAAARRQGRAPHPFGGVGEIGQKVGLVWPGGTGELHELARLVPQVNRARAAAGGLDQLAQHRVQHAVGVGLGGHVLAQVQKALDGLAHVGHHARQLVDLAHQRGGLALHRKIKPRNALRLVGQPVQAAPNAPTGPPPQGQHQQRHAQHQRPQAAALGGQVAQQFVHRGHHQQGQALAVPHVKGHDHPEHFAPAAVKDFGLAFGWVGGVQGVQRGLVDVGHVAEGERVFALHQHAVHVGVGQHGPGGIDQGKLGVGGHAHAVQAVGQVVQHHVNAKHGVARPAGLAQRQPHLAGGEKHIGGGQGGRTGAHRVLVPAPGAGVKPVRGLCPALQQVVVGGVKQKLPHQAARCVFGHGLHQKVGFGGRVEALAHGRVVQGAHQQKRAVGVRQVHGRNEGVGGQFVGQHVQAGQALGLGFGTGNGVKAELPQRGLRRLQHAPRFF